MSIREFAPAKINLALHVLGRRADGYHELDSVVAFASIGDELEISLAKETALQVHGPFAAEVPVTSDNLVLKAHAALAVEFQVPPVAMHLTKNLPVASGIGGGSADAAAALRGILKLAGLRIEQDVLQRVALSLGADVPVCMHGKACRMQGVGEVITSVDRLPTQAIVLVNPLKPCGTADVFRNMGLKPGDQKGTAVDALKPQTWRNDMTSSAIAVLPEIAAVLEVLSTCAPQATVRMSGSGATCFALFDNLHSATIFGAELARQHPNWWIAPAELM
jgi:4-diphosphocytidyl-2-C-methyl-D-erythritol kinase